MKKILIVEDEPDIQELLCAYLKDAGYETAAAADGVAALSLFQAQAFDLVLLDILLPKIDGFGVCELIRAQSQVPILMLTALDGEEEQLRGFGLNIDDYVTKPFSMPVLLEKIRVILGGAKIDWLSIWSNDKVILEAMEGTENTIHGIGYSCQDDASSLTITGEGALSIQNETGPAIAVSKNLTITAGNLTVQTASDTCPVIGRSVTSTTKDRTIENIKVLSGAKVTAVGGCKAVGIAGEDTTEKGIFIAPGTLSYRKNG